MSGASTGLAVDARVHKCCWAVGRRTPGAEASHRRQRRPGPVHLPLRFHTRQEVGRPMRRGAEVLAAAVGRSARNPRQMCAKRRTHLSAIILTVRPSAQILNRISHGMADLC